MAVIYGATGSGGKGGTGFASSIGASWSHTIATGDNFVIVSLTYYYNTGSAQTSACTYGGTAMTLLGDLIWDPHCTTSIYYMFNPPSGAQTVACSNSGGGNTGRQIEGNSVSYSGVGNVALLATNTGSGGTSTLAGISGPAASDLIYFVGSGWGGASSQSFTLRWGVNNGTYPSTMEVVGDAPGTTTSATVSPVNSPYSSWAMMAAHLRSPEGDFFKIF